MCVYICVTTERNQTLLVTLDLQILAIKKLYYMVYMYASWVCWGQPKAVGCSFQSDWVKIWTLRRCEQHKLRGILWLRKREACTVHAYCWMISWYFLCFRHVARHVWWCELHQGSAACGSRPAFWQVRRSKMLLAAGGLERHERAGNGWRWRRGGSATVRCPVFSYAVIAWYFVKEWERIAWNRMKEEHPKNYTVTLVLISIWVSHVLGLPWLGCSGSMDETT